MFVPIHIYFDELISIAVSDRKSIPVTDNSGSPTTKQLSDFNRNPRRGRTRSRTSRERRVASERARTRARVLIRGFSLRKASMQTVHEYEQTDAPRRGKKSRGWRLPPETREKDKRGRVVVLSSLSPGDSKGELT